MSPLARRGLLAALVVATLAPFLGKAFHVDDPMYLWIAQRILEHPLDAFGFAVNWNGYVLRVVQANFNPPLVSYYLAAVGGPLGFAEVTMHAAMLLPAVALALGVLALGRRLSDDAPFVAAAALATPLVVVSATTVMSDVAMLAAWCWTIVAWLDGLARQSRARLALAALGMGLCPLVKYFGVALAPLLFVYTAWRERRIGAWALWFLVPAAVLGAYHAHTWLSYGSLPLVAAGGFSVGARGDLAASFAGRGLVGLCFLGGGLAPLVAFAPWACPRRALCAGAALVLGLAAALPMVASLGPLALREGGAPRWDAIAQVSPFAVAGAGLLALALAELRRARDAEALLLAAWLLGTFVFAAWSNWSTNARAVLPAAPAAALLVARALSSRGALPPGRGLRFALLAPGLALSLLVAAADHHLAGSQRRAAAQLAERYAAPGVRLWFQGAWGFQWYMQAAGARKVDFANSRLLPGEILVVPEYNTGLRVPPAGAVEPIELVALDAFPLVSTLSPPLGAGFYADVYGPLPYAFGRAQPSRFTVYRVLREFGFP